MASQRRMSLSASQPVHGACPSWNAKTLLFHFSRNNEALMTTSDVGAAPGYYGAQHRGTQPRGTTAKLLTQGLHLGTTVRNTEAILRNKEALATKRHSCTTKRQSCATKRHSTTEQLLM